MAPVPKPSHTASYDISPWDRPPNDPVWLRAKPQIRLWRARALRTAGCPEAALEQLQDLESVLPEVGDIIWVMRAEMYEQQKSPDETLRAWQNALAAAQSSNISTTAALGVLRAAVGFNQVQTAEAALALASKLSPQHPQLSAARLQIARLLGAQGRAPEAAALCQKLMLTADPLISAEAGRLLATWVKLGLVAKTSPSDAVTLLDRALDAPQQDMAKQTVRLLDAQERATPAKARQDAASSGRAVRLTQTQKATEAGQAGRWAEAANIWQALAKKSPARERPLYQREWARALGRAGQAAASSQAYYDLARMMPRGPQFFDAYFRAAFAAYDGKNFSQARRLFERLVRLAPQDPRIDEVMWFSAWCAFHEKRFDVSLGLLARLIRRFPNSTLVPRAYFWRGRILELSGRRADAKQAYTKALGEGCGYYAGLARRRLQKRSSGTPSQATSACSTLSHEPLRTAFLPSSSESLQWQSERGRRIIRLLELGDETQAAEELFALGTTPHAAMRQGAIERVEFLNALEAHSQVLKHLDNSFISEQHWTPLTLRYLQSAYPRAFEQEVDAAATQFAVSPILLWSIMRQESSFDTKAESPVHAHGLMQLMQTTASRIASSLGTTPSLGAALETPATNIHLAAWYVRALLDQAEGNVAVALCGYNAGPIATQRWVSQHANVPTDIFVEDIPYKETRNYVKKVWSNFDTYTRLYDDHSAVWPETIKAPQTLGVDF